MCTQDNLKAGDVPIFLIGFMGVGKTATAKHLGTLLNRPVLDIDRCIERHCHISIPQIFERYGEAYFREKESALLSTLCRNNRQIISCGGGIALNPTNVQFMKQQGRIILLTASSETIYQRIKHSTHRPLLSSSINLPQINMLMKERSQAYTRAADFIIDTDGKSIAAVCQTLTNYLSL